MKADIEPMVGYAAAIRWIRELDLPEDQEDMRGRVIRRMEHEKSLADPVPPRFHKGRYGKKYDTYTCGICGASLPEIGWNYCPKCGRRITEQYLGGRRDAIMEEDDGADQSL